MAFPESVLVTPDVAELSLEHRACADSLLRSGEPMCMGGKRDTSLSRMEASQQPFSHTFEDSQLTWKRDSRFFDEDDSVKDRDRLFPVLGVIALAETFNPRGKGDAKCRGDGGEAPTACMVATILFLIDYMQSRRFGFLKICEKSFRLCHVQ